MQTRVFFCSRRKAGQVASFDRDLKPAVAEIPLHQVVEHVLAYGLNGPKMLSHERELANMRAAADNEARVIIFGASTLGSRVYLFSFSSPFPWRESLPP